MLETRTIETKIGKVHDNYIEKIDYTNFDLKILLTCNRDTKKILITFVRPHGFRVLDEGNLLEFWPQCSTPNGWIFEILSGGWKSLESTRDGFLNSDFNEYLITGNDECINVFSTTQPSIEEL